MPKASATPGTKPPKNKIRRPSMGRWVGVFFPTSHSSFTVIQEALYPAPDETLRRHHRLRLVSTPRLKINCGGSKLLEALLSAWVQSPSVGRTIPLQASRSPTFHRRRGLLHQISPTPR